MFSINCTLNVYYIWLIFACTLLFLRLCFDHIWNVTSWQFHRIAKIEIAKLKALIMIKVRHFHDKQIMLWRVKVVRFPTCISNHYLIVRKKKQKLKNKIFWHKKRIYWFKSYIFLLLVPTKNNKLSITKYPSLFQPALHHWWQLRVITADDVTRRAAVQPSRLSTDCKTFDSS